MTNQSSIQSILDKYKRAEEKARQSGKVEKVCAGVYVGIYGKEAWYLFLLDENPGKPWMAEKAHYAFKPDYTDPFPTLRELKESMGRCDEPQKEVEGFE